MSEEEMALMLFGGRNHLCSDKGVGVRWKRSGGADG